MGIFRGLKFKINNIESILNRYCSTKTNKNTIKYTDTINLPKTKFPPRLSAAKRSEIERQLNSVRVNFLIIFNSFYLKYWIYLFCILKYNL